MQSTSREGKQKVPKISGHWVERVHVCADFWPHVTKQAKLKQNQQQTDRTSASQQVKEITQSLYPNVNKHSQVWDFAYKQLWKIKLKSKSPTYISETTSATIPHKGKERHDIKFSSVGKQAQGKHHPEEMTKDFDQYPVNFMLI